MRTETIASVKFLRARNSVRETVFSYLKLETEETENTELNYYSLFLLYCLFFFIVTESLKTTSNPPEVTVTLLRNEDLPGKSVPLDKRQLPIDILLLTVKEWEFLACISCFKCDFCRSYCKELGQDVYLGEVWKDDMMLNIAVVKCYTGSTVPQGSCVVVMKAVEVLGPKAVFCVGCCGGLDPAKVKLGDVLVSVKLISYSSSNVTDKGITELGFKVPLKANISKLMLSAADGWIAPVKNLQEFEVKMHQGVFLSGPEIVDSSARREELNQRFSEAVVIETEGEGNLNKFQLYLNDMLSSKSNNA